MIVGFLREFAEVEAFVGNSSGATALYDLADKVRVLTDDACCVRLCTGFVCEAPRTLGRELA